MWLILASLFIFISVPLATAESGHHIITEYTFAEGNDGWAIANDGKSGMNIRPLNNPNENGALQLLLTGGSIEGSNGPIGHASWIDGPLFDIEVDDSMYVVLRMKHMSGGRYSSIATLWMRNAAITDFAMSQDLNIRHEWPENSYFTKSFPIVADGKWHTYVVPLVPHRQLLPVNTFHMTQLRLFPQMQTVNGVTSPPASIVPDYSTSIASTVLLDFIRIARAPTIHSVQGCSPIAFAPVDERTVSSVYTSEFLERYTPQPISLATPLIQPPYRETYRDIYALDQFFATSDNALHRVHALNSHTQFSSTYNCMRSGGDLITIKGTFFGSSSPEVFVNGKSCPVADFESQRSVSCYTPPGTGSQVSVEVRNSKMPYLYDVKPLLSYAETPPIPTQVTVSNIASHSVEVGWAVPLSDPWASMTITGYVLQWRIAIHDDYAQDDVFTNSDLFNEKHTPVDPATVSTGWKASDAEFESREVVGATSAGLLVKPLSGSAVTLPLLGGEDAADAGTSPNPGVGGKPVANGVVWSPWGPGAGGGEIFLCNRTQTTVRNLLPGRRYQFRVSAVREDTNFLGKYRSLRYEKQLSGQPLESLRATKKSDQLLLEKDTYFLPEYSELMPLWAQCDRYGQRMHLASSALVSTWSTPTPSIRTAVYDFLFSHFTANSTLDHGPLNAASSVNALHWSGGEGHYGLVAVGSAHVGGCNATHVCCDGFGGENFLSFMRWALWEGETGKARIDLASKEYVPSAVTHPYPKYAWSEHRGEYIPVVAHAPGTDLEHSTITLGNAYEFLTEVNPLAYPESLATHADHTADIEARTGATHVIAESKPAIPPGHLPFLDLLLTRGYGLLPSSNWFSTLHSEPASGWLEYEDSGHILFVPQSVLDLLDAKAEAEEMAYYEARLREYKLRTGEDSFATGSRAFAGRYNDSRVAPDEHLKGPIDPLTGAPGPVPDPDPEPTGRRRRLQGVSGQWTSGDPISLRSVHSSRFDPGTPGSEWEEARGMGSEHGLGHSSVPGFLDPAPQKPTGAWETIQNDPKLQRIRKWQHRDEMGRLLIGRPDNPTDTCSLTCTAITSPYLSVLSGNTQTSIPHELRAPLPHEYGYAGANTVPLSGQFPTPVDPNTPLPEESLRTPSGPGFRLDANAIYGVSLPSVDRVELDAMGNPVQDLYLWPPQVDLPIAGRYSTGTVSDPLEYVVREPLPRCPAQPLPIAPLAPSSRVFPSAALPEITKHASAPCGPALRLTPSQGSAAGAAWYARPVDVREGFDTSFLFRLANPSRHCRTMDGVHSHCRSRGGNGFALVIQTSSPGIVGAGGPGNGYDGIPSSLAIEFDTWSDGGLWDPYENHISVHTRGRAPNSANTTFSLASSTWKLIPDLTRGIVAVRVVYLPPETATSALADQGSPSSHAAHDRTSYSAGFTTSLSQQYNRVDPLYASETHKKADPHQRLEKGQTGILRVYVNGESTPVISTPFDISELGVDETHGRAWVGFTASTGDNVWQNHDILAWHFSSLRMD